MNTYSGMVVPNASNKQWRVSKGGSPIVIEATYIGLDPAATTGVGLWLPEASLGLVWDFKGEPYEQLEKILKAVRVDPSRFENSFGIETQHHFRNAVTARSILTRVGYMKYRLIETGHTVTDIEMNSVKKFFGVKTKQELFMRMTPHFSGSYLTSDNTDALAIAMYMAHMQGNKPNLDDYTILRGDAE